MEKTTLSNGLEVYLDERKRFGESEVDLLVESGSFHERIPQTAHVLEHLQAVKSLVYGNSGKLNYANSNAGTQQERQVYYFDSILPEHLCLAAENLAKALGTPNLEVLTREKEAVRHELLRNLRPGEELSEEVTKILFPNYFEKRKTAKELVDSLSCIDEEAVNEFWSANYDPANSFLYIGGEFPKKMDKALRIFEQIPTRGKKPSKIVIPEDPEITQRIVINKKIRDDKNASIVINYKVPKFPEQQTFKEEIAVELLSKYLGASHGLLYMRLRDEKGLCYSLDMGHVRDLGSSAGLYFSTITRPGLTPLVEKEFLEVIKNIAENGISEDELDAFKNGEKIKLASEFRTLSIKGILMEREYGKTLIDRKKEVEKITSEDIKKYAQLLATKPYVVAIGIPLEQ
ncbi:insulinase family protein [Candidatus Woesearchaeota archaeon]|nr:insulinase family protein [Candidatus Woesearchaeota archaeon]